ncbi:hypothetical protein D3C72_1320460 [compost metagenome]
MSCPEFQILIFGVQRYVPLSALAPQSYLLHHVLGYARHWEIELEGQWIQYWLQIHFLPNGQFPRVDTAHHWPKLT